jgi:hypothetical protein
MDSTNGDTGRATSVGLSEAVLIWRGWVEDKALIRCELRFLSLAAVLLGRAVEASATRLRLVSAEKGSELVLPIRDDFIFEYTDMRDGPPEHIAKYNGLMVVYFPFENDPDEADWIVLCEMKE